MSGTGPVVGVPTNVRVSQDEFLAVWAEADRRAAETGATDWYVRAVLETCRWLAAAPLRTALCGGLPRSPVTQRASRARPELIAAEWDAAQEGRFSPELAERPGWDDGARATLGWARSGQGPAPLDPGRPRGSQ